MKRHRALIQWIRRFRVPTIAIACGSIGMVAKLDAQGAPPGQNHLGIWSGGLDRTDSYAPLRIQLRPDSTIVDAIGFSFLGAGSLSSGSARVRRDTIAIQFVGGSGEQYAVTAVLREDTLSGVAHSGPRQLRFRALRSIESRRIRRPASRVWRMSNGQDWYLGPTSVGIFVSDIHSGMRRRGIAVDSNRFLIGAELETAARQPIAMLVLKDDGTIEYTDIRTGTTITGSSRVTVSHEIEFDNAGVRLSGTLLLPDQRPPYPAVVFLHGSGPVTRDSDLETAYHFRSLGFAAFVYDKRGTGKSQGNWQTATMDELAGDARAAVRALRARNDIVANRVGVHGTSQGGWVAAYAAASGSEIGFVLTISGPGVPADTQEIFRRTLNLAGNGYIPGTKYSAADSAAADSLIRRTFSFIRTGVGAREVDSALRAGRREPWFPVTELPDSLFTIGEHDWMPGFRSQAQFLPTVAWSRIRAPALVMYGLQDPFVPAELSAERIRGATARSGNLSIRVVVLPDADHWMYKRSAAAPRAPSPGYDPSYLKVLREFLTSVRP